MKKFLILVFFVGFSLIPVRLILSQVERNQGKGLELPIDPKAREKAKRWSEENRAVQERLDQESRERRRERERRLQREAEGEPCLKPYYNRGTGREDAACQRFVETSPEATVRKNGEKVKPTRVWACHLNRDAFPKCPEGTRQYFDTPPQAGYSCNSIAWNTDKPLPKEIMSCPPPYEFRAFEEEALGFYCTNGKEKDKSIIWEDETKTFGRIFNGVCGDNPPDHDHYMGNPPDPAKGYGDSDIFCCGAVEE